MPIDGTCGHVQNANTCGEIGDDDLKGVRSGNIRNFDMFNVNMVTKGISSDNKEKEYFLWTFTVYILQKKNCFSNM